MKSVILSFFLLHSFIIYAQEDSGAIEKSNIQNYTPSKLLEKGKVDIKWFNNLYTQTKEDRGGVTVDVPRSTFFTTSLEVFTGITNSKKLNIGLIAEYRYNVFEFELFPIIPTNTETKVRTGFSHIAPSIKIAPFSSLPRFSAQSSFFIPAFEKESDENGFLAQKSFIWQNRFFYDYTFRGNKFQLFSDLGTRLFIGDKEEGFANNSLELAPGVFFSYFPTNKFTISTFMQHAQLLDLGNNFTQNYSAVGAGAKYQLNNVLNVETLYSKFVRGTYSGLGQSFNLGLRAIF